MSTQHKNVKKHWKVWKQIYQMLCFVTNFHYCRNYIKEWILANLFLHSIALRTLSLSPLNINKLTWPFLPADLPHFLTTCTPFPHCLHYRIQGRWGRKKLANKLKSSIHKYFSREHCTEVCQIHEPTIYLT